MTLPIPSLTQDELDKLSKKDLDDMMLRLKDIQPTADLSDDELAYICRVHAAARRTNSGPPRTPKASKAVDLETLSDSLFD